MVDNLSLLDSVAVLQYSVLHSKFMSIRSIENQNGIEEIKIIVYRIHQMNDGQIDSTIDLFFFYVFGPVFQKQIQAFSNPPRPKLDD
jgi:hypothetical protein